MRLRSDEVEYHSPFTIHGSIDYMRFETPRDASAEDLDAIAALQIQNSDPLRPFYR